MAFAVFGLELLNGQLIFRLLCPLVLFFEDKCIQVGEDGCEPLLTTLDLRAGQSLVLALLDPAFMSQLLSLDCSSQRLFLWGARLGAACKAFLAHR